MPGTVVLVGGDEFRPGCETMDSYLLVAVSPGSASILIIPTAAVTNPSKAASDGVRYFSLLGARASELMILDRQRANDEVLCNAIFQASHVYFTGGNPNHLLTTLKGSLLLQCLEEWLAKGGVLAGSSAGAMVMGSAMRHLGTDDWAQGLGIVQGMAVLPHHEKSDPNIVAQTLEETAPKGLRVLGIDARTCCIGMPGSWKAVGVGKVTAYQGGSWQTFNSGEMLPPGF